MLPESEQYRWLAEPDLSCTNCNQPLVHPANDTKYVVEGTSAMGCKNMDSVLIKVLKPFKITTSPNDTLCIGASAQLAASGADRYTWSPSFDLNNPLVANPIAKPEATATYQVVGSDSQFCFYDTGFVTVSVFPMPTFDITEEEVTINIGNSIGLHSTSSQDVVRWRWIPYAGLSCNTCPDPVAAPRSTTTYIAEGINQGGCKTTDQVTVTVICNNTNIFIPNTFSPNGDGVNDVFYPRGKGIAQIRAFTIFDRWGNVIYQKTNFGINDQQAGWNGTYHGKKADQGVYLYSVDVVCDNSQTMPIKGDVTLMR